MYLKQLQMSYKMSTRNNTTTKQPFCKVCFDANRENYNTHFLKDFSGPRPVVLCPYLLSLKCNYCKEQGHTVSYCDILKAKNSSELTQSRKESSSQNGKFFILRVSKDNVTTITHAPMKTVSQKKSVSMTNQFALLEEDDEWEMPKYNSTKKSPILTEVAVPEPLMPVEEISAFPTWANIVAMPPPKKVAPPTNEVLKKDVTSLFVSTSTIELSNIEKSTPPTFVHTKPVRKMDNKYVFSRNWADDDSSEEDSL